MSTENITHEAPEPATPKTARTAITVVSICNGLWLTLLVDGLIKNMFKSTTEVIVMISLYIFVLTLIPLKSALRMILIPKLEVKPLTLFLYISLGVTISIILYKTVPILIHRIF